MSPDDAIPPHCCQTDLKPAQSARWNNGFRRDEIAVVIGDANKFALTIPFVMQASCTGA
jgi:hypothetical protein